MGNLIVKSNAFVGASYGLGTTEQRLILLAILKARETDSIGEVIGKRLIIHASEYMQVFGVDRATAYESLENAVKGLYESEYRYIEILANGERKTHRYRFVGSIAYADGLGQVEFTFTPETVPLVVGLSENFTKYEIEQVVGLSSQYALRLYELLACWRGKGKFTVDLAELRFKFALLDDEYTRMDNFKRKVLDTAIDEINKHTDLTVSYEQHKRGRVITGFTFNIKQKAKSKAVKINERDQNTTDLFTSLTDKQLARIANSKKFIADYGELVSPNNPANQSTSAWISHMVEWLKKEPERFTKRPAQEYLDDEQQVRF